MRLAVLLGTANPMPAASPSSDDGSINADHLTFRVQGASGVSGLISCIGLDHPFDLSSVPASMVLPRALMIPVVRVSLRPRIPQGKYLRPTTISLESQN